MKTKFLLPHRFKILGWLIFIPALILGILHLIVFSFQNIEFLREFLIKINPETKVFALLSQGLFQDTVYFKVVETHILHKVIAVLIILGGMFIAFSRQRTEDEFIAKIRLESLVWAIYINYAILLFCFLFIHGIVFMQIMVMNLFSILIVFILRFHYLLYKLKKSINNEK